MTVLWTSVTQMVAVVELNKFAEPVMVTSLGPVRDGSEIGVMSKLAVNAPAEWSPWQESAEQLE
jgi:hypothetical protein